MKNNMEAILRIINSDPELKAKFETAVDNYCNSREWQLLLAWETKKHNLTGDQMEALTFALEWADAHPHWISVEDELPTCNVFVLTCDGQGNTNLLTLAGNGGWYDHSVAKHRNITHWMPKPQPPKSGSSEFPNNCKKKGGEE